MNFTIPIHEHGEPGDPDYPHRGGRGAKKSLKQRHKDRAAGMRRDKLARGGAEAAKQRKRDDGLAKARAMAKTVKDIRDRDAKRVTRVGITSARPKDAPDYRGARVVYQNMHGVADQLRALPGVSKVTVQPGVGAWKTDWEPSWILGYRGNGEARRLMAKVGKLYNQDSVLLMHGCKGADCDPAVELTFQKPKNLGQMAGINTILGEAGFGGWTWGKRAGHTVLRVVSVPAWGGERQQHLDTMQRVSGLLKAEGHSHRFRVKSVRTEVFERDTYDAVIGEGDAPGT